MPTEADTCRTYVLPALYGAGWTDGQIREQVSFTPGRIIVNDGKVRRGKRKRVDYLLSYLRDRPIAVVEAKSEYRLPSDGLQQAKEYAELLDLKFAYSTNGPGIVEHDYTTGLDDELDIYPSPDELWRRDCLARGLRPDDAQLRAPYFHEQGREPRYYQDISIHRATEADVTRWRAALDDQPGLVERLRRERSWRYWTMRELELGFDRGRITIPVRNHRRRLIGLLRYQPWPAGGQRKMRAAVGSRRQLLPHPAAEPSQRIVLVEGEPDMIAARSRRLPAIALPGVESWRPEWAADLAGRQITIVMDADEQGRAAARRIADDLKQHSQTTIIDLAPDRLDGYDVTDWLMAGPRSELGELR